jgi:uncharacterized beta-barrel protein YwiB (DUF1934 family)
MKTIYYKQGKEDDGTEIITKAMYRKKGNIAQIMYEDSEATGFFESETKVTTNGSNFVSIIRQGSSIGSDLMIQCGKKLFSEYNTPLGSMEVGVMGLAIDNQLGEDGGTLYMRYVLDVNGALLSENEMTITVRLI